MGFPKYISICGHSIIRLTHVKKGIATYTRDAGVWSVKAKYVGGELRVKTPGKMHSHYRLKCEVVTEEAWIKDNIGYL